MFSHLHLSRLSTHRVLVDTKDVFNEMPVGLNFSSFIVKVIDGKHLPQCKPVKEIILSSELKFFFVFFFQQGHSLLKKIVVCFTAMEQNFLEKVWSFFNKKVPSLILILFV